MIHDLQTDDNPLQTQVSFSNRCFICLCSLFNWSVYDSYTFSTSQMIANLSIFQFVDLFQEGPGWSGAGVGVGMLRGRGFLGFLVVGSSVFGFLVSCFFVSWVLGF